MPIATTIAVATTVAAGAIQGLAWTAIAINAALAAAGSLVLGGLSKALTKKPKAPDFSASLRDRTVTLRQPIAPWRVIYGQVRVGGTPVFIKSNNNNNFLHMVNVMAAHEVEEIGTIYFDDTEVPLAENNAGYIPSSGNWYAAEGGWIYLEKQIGTRDQQASNYLVSQGLGWTADHRLRGKANLYVRLFWDPDKWPNGIPNITAVLKGRKVYDPRDADQDPDDDSTWEWSANPALCLADYLTNTSFGLGCSYADEIDEDALIEAANICDEQIPLSGGGFENRYTCNGEFTTDKTPQNIIEELLTAMAGKAIFSGGKWRIYAGAYRTPTVTLDESHLRAGFTVTTRISRRENFNAVKGVFISPDHSWQPTDFPPVISATYLAEDNNERVFKDINLPYTTSGSMAQRLAKIELLKARQQITVQLRCNLNAYQVQAGDVIYLNNTRMGWSSKAFEVVSHTLVIENDDSDIPYLAVDLGLRETASNVYDWDASEEQDVDPAPDTDLPDPFLVEPPGVPSVSEELYETRDSSGVKSKAVIEWEASPSAFVSTYQVQFVEVGGTTTNVLPITRDTRFEIPDMVPGTYDFSVKAISDLGVSSAFVTTRKEIVGLLDEPADVTNLTVVAVSGMAWLQWDRHPDLDVRNGGYLRFKWSPVQSGATWDSAIDIGDVVDGNRTQVGLPLVSGTYLVKARDSSGVWSANAASVTNNGASPFTYTGIGTISEGTAFSGTKTNVGVSGGKLSLAGSALFDDITALDSVTDLDTEGGIAASGTYNFNAGFDGTTVRKMRVTGSASLLVVNTLDQIDSRGASVDDWENWDGTAVASAGVRLYLRTTDNDPSGTAATWSNWQRFPAVADLNCRGVQFKAELFTDDPAYNLEVGTLGVSIDTLSA
jgi:hypothetical protein